MFEDTYISIDVETTGKIPSVHKMLSVGCVPIVNGEIQKYNSRQFFIKEINLDAVEKGMVDYQWDEDTHKWWMTQNKPAWNRLDRCIREQGQHPAISIEQFYEYLLTLPGEKKVMVADPATFDAGFIWEYLWRWVGQYAIDKLGYMRMVDIRTMRMMRYNVAYSKANRDLVPAEVTAGEAITHDALDDAMCQAKQFVYLMNKLTT
jgi:DNA polymerase III epsilon subunit-like protein